MPIKVLGLSLYGPLAASTRYRLSQYIPGLRLQGIELEVKSLLGDGYLKKSFAGEKYSSIKLIGAYLERAALLVKQGGYDMAIVNAELFPLLPGFIEARLLHIPYIYDFDDAFFLKYRLDRFKRVSFLLKNKFDPLVSNAAAILAGNYYLENYAKQWSQATKFFPTVVDTDRYIPVAAKRADIFTVGWIGSPSTSVYLELMALPLEQLGLEGATRFVVVGGYSPDIPGVEVINMPWCEDTEVDIINSFDVGVMPLFCDEWARGKCAFKLIQYMACGIPVIASPVGANIDVLTEECGYMANTPLEWLNALRLLRDQPEKRALMGAVGRERVFKQYSLHSNLPVLVDTIKQLVSNVKVNI